MSDEIKKDKKTKDIDKKPEKIFRVTNIKNSPYEFHIHNDYFRLEPRNKEGDSIELSEKQINSKDFAICIKHIDIKEI